MPVTYFERLGYEPVERREPEVLLWKRFVPSATPPALLRSTREFEPLRGKIAVDLFWNGFCQTGAIEAQRTREVRREFGDRVALRKYCADDRATPLRHQIPRGIYMNGSEIG